MLYDLFCSMLQYKLQLINSLLNMCDSSKENVTLVAISALLFGYGIKLQERKRRRCQTILVKPWRSRRNELCAYGTLINELAMMDREDYRRFMRMNTETFTALIEKLFCT